MNEIKFLLPFFLILSLKNISSAEASQDDSLKVSEVISDTVYFDDNSTEENLLEDFYEGSDEEITETPDYHESLKKNPLNLNSATASELSTIPFLNPVIANSIINYRNKIIYFKTKRSLLKVDGISKDLYAKIKIYLIAKKPSGITAYGNLASNNTPDIKPGFSNLNTLIKSRFFQELQPKAGYLDGKYAGSRPKLYLQMNTNLSNNNFGLEGSLTVEKDAGENNLTDFVSGYAGFKNYKFVNSLIAGDYILNFAQGLAMWSSYSFSKGTDAVSPLKKKGKTATGYRSVNEVQFFRGLAADLSFDKFNLNLFYSDNFIDATPESFTGEVSSFYYDGYHRTSSEILRKNSIKEKLAGGRLTYGIGSLRLGATYWRSRFSKPVKLNSSLQLYNFSGNKAEMAGVDYDYVIQNMNIYGEFARSKTGSIASLNSIQFTFFRIANILLSYRNYPEDFTAIHSSGFGEKNGTTKNEKGFYGGIYLKPFKGLYINTYFDQYKFPYRSFSDPVSVTGNDFLLSTEWRTGKGLTFIFKYKSENGEETRTVSDDFGRSIKRTDYRLQQNARAGLIYQINKIFRIRGRYEFVNVDYKNYGGDSRGNLFYTDLRAVPQKGLTLDFRYIIFDTENYDSRIYEFENDIDGVMSNIPLYGKGRRLYLLVNYKPFPFVIISGKYAETYYEGVKSIGSGNERINGNLINRISLGLVLKL